nr:uncharacterized protein LOC128672244 [Plodia interpunctella]
MPNLRARPSDIDNNNFSNPMFMNSVETINSKLENISLDIQNKMHPKADRPPVASKNQLPQLHLTPSECAQKRTDNSSPRAVNPCLLKPQHDIPATPPPQTNPQTLEFFPKRIG